MARYESVAQRYLSLAYKSRMRQVFGKQLLFRVRELTPNDRASSDRRLHKSSRRIAPFGNSSVEYQERIVAKSIASLGSDCLSRKRHRRGCERLKAGITRTTTSIRVTTTNNMVVVVGSLHYLRQRMQRVARYPLPASVEQKDRENGNGARANRG